MQDTQFLHSAAKKLVFDIVFFLSFKLLLNRAMNGLAKRTRMIDCQMCHPMGHTVEKPHPKGVIHVGQDVRP